MATRGLIFPMRIMVGLFLISLAKTTLSTKSSMKINLFLSQMQCFLTPKNKCIPLLKNLFFLVDFVLQENQNRVVLIYNYQSSSLGANLLKYRIGCSVENDTKSILAKPKKFSKFKQKLVTYNCFKI